MPLYLVESEVPGVTRAQLATMCGTVRETCQTFATAGKHVRYIRCTFLPGESRYLSVFEAPNAERVREMHEVAQLPYNRIITALDLDP